MSPAPLPLLRAAEVPHSTRGTQRGEIASVARGVYAASGEWWALSPRQRALARVHAHLLRHPDAVMCLESAALLWGLPTLGQVDAVHVLSGATSPSHRGEGIRVHTSAHGDRVIEEVDGIRLTSVADTCVDIARARHPAAALVIADATVRRDPRTSAATLVAVNEDRTSDRGRRRARWALQRANGAAECALESVSRAAIEWWGFPPPRLNRWIGDTAGGSDRADMWWPELRVAGEADDSATGNIRLGDPAAAERARRERDRRLRRSGARTVVRWSWDDLADPSAFRHVLTSAGLTPEAPPDLDALAGLRHLLLPRLPPTTARRPAGDGPTAARVEDGSRPPTRGRGGEP